MGYKTSTATSELTHQNSTSDEASDDFSGHSFNAPAVINLSDHSFAKAFRLLTPKDFQQVFAKAEKFANRHWTFIVRPNQKAYPRIGLAIAKKQLNRAVWRNRIKRLARETFRQHKQALSGYDIVVLTRHGVQEIDATTLRKSFTHLIRQVSGSGLKEGNYKKPASASRQRLKKSSVKGRSTRKPASQS